MTVEGQYGASRIVALFPELLGVGGIQEAGRLTAVALNEIAAKRGWSTEFLALNDDAGPQDLRYDQTVIPFRGFNRSKLGFMRGALRLAGGDTRIVLVAHPHLAIPAAQMKLMNCRLKMLTISHGIEAWDPLPWFRRVAFRKSDFFLAPSQYTVERVAEAQSVPRARVHRLAWPLSPEIFRMAAQTGKLPVPARFPYGLVVLAVARLVRSENYKGVDKLIEAIALLRQRIHNLHLVIVGGGDDLARHIRLASDSGVSDCVHFFDKLTRAEIAGCYSRAAVFALPSTGEGFGLVFLEAMAFGKPLIGAAAGGVPDVIEDGTNGFLVLPGDFDQLCQALTVMLTNQELRAELGAKGAELVRTKYRFDRFSTELESILCDCGLET